MRSASKSDLGSQASRSQRRSGVVVPPVRKNQSVPRLMVVRSENAERIGSLFFCREMCALNKLLFGIPRATSAINLPTSCPSQSRLHRGSTAFQGQGNLPGRQRLQEIGSLLREKVFIISVSGFHEV